MDQSLCRSVSGTDFRATTKTFAPWPSLPAALANLSGGRRFEIRARDTFEKAIPVDGIAFFIARQVVLLAYWLSTDRALCFWEVGEAAQVHHTVRQLIGRMVRENPAWGEERVADELSLKLAILVSPRTVRAYWPSQSSPKGTRRTSSQHWQTFVRNHATSITACDFLVAVTARFRVLYVFVMMEVGSRRILHCNVTAHPNAEWTLQQFREAFPSDHDYRFLIHDHDSIFSAELDKELKSFGLKHSRRTVPISRSQYAFALGACTGVRSTWL